MVTTRNRITLRRCLSLEELEDRSLLSVDLPPLFDINPLVAFRANEPTELTEVNGTIFFVANAQTFGIELWKTDGTDAGTVMVKDIMLGSGYSSPSHLTNVGGVLFFSAADSVGRELWKSDGTESGTVRVKDIRPGQLSSDPALLTNVNGTLFFVANDGTHGFELWRSDGTEEGTLLVRDIRAGADSSFDFFTMSPVIGSSMVNVSGTMFFKANDGSRGNELWKSDGTESGTVLVKDIFAGFPSGLGFTSPFMTNVNGTLFFVGEDLAGSELWRSDGSTEGTIRVKDIVPGGAGSFPMYLTNVDGKLYFSSSAASGRELWRSDGTETGTFMVWDIMPGVFSSSPADLTNVNGQLFFVARDGVHGAELWTSDGTETGTVLVKDIHPGSGSSLSITGNMANVAGTLFFAANDGAHGVELWKTDGTSTGTIMIKDIRPGPLSGMSFSIASFAAHAGTLYFRAADDVASNWVWRSDGTEEGTARVSDIFSGTVHSTPGVMTNVNGTWFFSAEDGSHGRELWRSDGTVTGTMMVKDIRPGPGSSAPSQLTNVNGTLFFVASNESTGIELWKSDGTSSGSMLVKDIAPGVTSSSPNSLTNVAGRLFFAANDHVHGPELWTTDGTEFGTRMVKDIHQGINQGSSIGQLTNVAGLLHFVANDGVHGLELWKSDGTSEGTQLVADIFTGPASSAPGNLTNASGTLYFTANDGTHGAELWKSDGSPAGTTLVKDVLPGPISGVGTNALFTTVGDILYFIANDGESGLELWKSDGATTGTTLVKDINVGPALGLSVASSLLNFGGVLFFSATDGASGYELWRSDGTSQGTEMVRDIHTGPASSVPRQLSNVAGVLYFTANDGIHGEEPWRSDGTTEGTRIAANIASSTGGSDLLWPTPIGDNVAFSANTIGFGREFYVFSSQLPEIVDIRIRGSAWNPSLAGFSLMATMPASPLPWINLNSIEIEFDKPIAPPTTASVQLVRGSDSSNLIPSSVLKDPNSDGRIWQWTIDEPLLTDTYELIVFGTHSTAVSITDTAGQWIGTDTTLLFEVVLGDVNASRRTTITDAAMISSKIGEKSLLLSRFDLNGTGEITEVDLNLALDQIGQQLPFDQALPLLRVTAAGPGSTSSLDQTVFAPLLSIAVDRFLASSVGLTSMEAQILRTHVSFEVVDLPETQLSRAEGMTVNINATAAGWDWFIDPTPDDDLEFHRRLKFYDLVAHPSQAAHEKIDLLTVVMHELGRMVGLDAMPNLMSALMQDRLPPSTRRLPQHLPAIHVDYVFSESLGFTKHLAIQRTLMTLFDRDNLHPELELR